MHGVSQETARTRSFLALPLIRFVASGKPPLSLLLENEGTNNFSASQVGCKP